MSLDGFAILKSVAGHAELFSDARDAVDKAALNILAAQFKAKTFDLDRLKRAYKVLGADTLSLALDHFPDTLPRALIRRIDPNHPHAAEGAALMCSRIVSLASGAVKPEAKAEKPAKKRAGSAKGKSRPKTEEDSITEGFWATSVMAKPQRSSKARRQSR
jgi:hypothetical protein